MKKSTKKKNSVERPCHKSKGWEYRSRCTKRKKLKRSVLVAGPSLKTKGWKRKIATKQKKDLMILKNGLKKWRMIPKQNPKQGRFLECGLQCALDCFSTR